jgi:hypothetical protein
LLFDATADEINEIQVPVSVLDTGILNKIISNFKN